MYPSISADGRFVAFESGASTLVAGDTNGFYDVFVHDRQLGTTERVSVATGGVQGNGHSANASISAEGRFVAFESYATNLVVGDTNGTGDVFVHDRQSGTTERVSVATNAVEGNHMSFMPSISADGRFVAFSSAASTLVTGDTNGLEDVFVRDRQLGTTERVSVATGGVQGNSSVAVFYSVGGSITGDGRFVAFTTTAFNLVAGDTNHEWDVFVHDRQAGTTERVSVATNGAQGNSHSGSPSISADGRFVVFYSNASNFFAGDTNGEYDVFVHDRQLGTTECMSVAIGGAPGNFISTVPSISADGRFVAFYSLATNLVAGDTNGRHDVFVRDRQLGTTARVSVSTSGAQGNNGSDDNAISANGRFVAFASGASNLVAGDTGSWDIFVRDRGPAPAIAAFCFGDGAGTACPCTNTGITGRGCKSSAALSIGCLLSAVDSSGNPNPSTSVTANVLGLKSEGMNMGSYCFFFQGTGTVAGGPGAVSPSFDGLDCVGGTIVRLGFVTTMDGTNTLAGVAGLAGLSASAQTRYYQTVYRNAAAFCTPATLNTSNALAIAWEP
jgi:Tol biopolymer transport system component